LPEFRVGTRAHLIQIALGRRAHGEKGLLRHAPHDRIGIQELGGLADRSNASLQARRLRGTRETTGLVEGQRGDDLARPTTGLSRGRLAGDAQRSVRRRDGLDGILRDGELEKTSW
jgi:hypothetical protein